MDNDVIIVALKDFVFSQIRHENIEKIFLQNETTFDSGKRR